MKNAYSDGEGIQLESSPNAETLSYVYFGRSMKMQNDLEAELNRRSRAA